MFKNVAMEEYEVLPELHHLERTVLLALKNDKRMRLNDLERRTGLPEASVSRATLWLSSKGLVKLEEEKRTLVSLGPEGERFLKTGFPERFLVETVIKNGGSLPLDRVPATFRRAKEEIIIALGWARTKGWLQIVRKDSKTVLIADKKPRKGADEKLIEAVSSGTLLVETLNPELADGLRILRNRPKVLRLIEKTERFVSPTLSGLEAVQKVVEITEVSQLTPEVIQSGKWRNVRLRRYDIKAPAIGVWPGKKQPFLRFLDQLKWKLAALGFKQMEGPIVEFTFFNCDVLYMPQNHPAREIHDMYYVKYPSKGDLSPYSDLAKRVKLAHENGWTTGSKGWGYDFSLKETEKLILRSQGTALSARMLVDKKLEIPGKYFSISRCYRPDIVDRTHLTEFNQLEGIVIGKELTFRNLLGVLERFALDIAEAEKVKFRPDYFPFTEPSVELAAYKDGLGWIEFGGAGLLRPEVTLPLGINVPVAAWGLGVNRIFMMKSGLSDIRDIFTQNLKWLRMQRVS